ncbi:acyl-CoA dehydrogenase family protein [Embleya scabrispora]|uniref:acyl-CoA dehydrogenase family protein n=1 Tax=Embleya scabrispora TaxID=159449 RepID=UPI0003720C5F|nr:acyl-CoA dehydrogenase family protein [Embleya scabrispora]MYS82717.1 acyl-CoA dehydrogenase [Streptomyces sp. SID5474]
MPVDRLLPTDEAHDLIARTRAFADRELASRVAGCEADASYPTGLFTALGRAGLSGLPYPVRYGGGGQPYEVYLQVVEELAARWAAVAGAVDTHTLACLPTAAHGTDAQREQWLPGMLDGALTGGGSRSEPHVGADPSAVTCRAERTRAGHLLQGTQFALAHGGRAHFHTVFARTGPARPDVSCFLAPGADEYLYFAAPEEATALRAIPTTTAYWDGVYLEPERLIGAPGRGLRIAFDLLDAGRLGGAACATGLAQAALDVAGAFVTGADRHLPAEAAAAVDSARAIYLDAARRRDAGISYTRQASVAESAAVEAAVKATAAAVRILGAVADTDEFPVRRYAREAAVLRRRIAAAGGAGAGAFGAGGGGGTGAAAGVPVGRRHGSGRGGALSVRGSVV